MTTYIPPRFPATDLPLPTGHRHRIPNSVKWAVYSDGGPMKNFLKKPGSNSASQKAGKRYEAKILKELDNIGNGRPIKNPWLHYADDSGLERYCQPDALFFRKSYLIIFEVKLCHTMDAYWQLRKQYSPVMKVLEPGLPQHLVEITRSFDPAVRFPEEMKLFFDMRELLFHLDEQVGTPPQINVIQWKL